MAAEATRNIAVELEYDGTALLGSQFQAQGRTVQGELEAAWQRFSGETVRWTFAGRTDAGVHARGQVANVRTSSHQPATTVQRALNALLPADIAIRRAWDVPMAFHARFSATRRDYRYVLLAQHERSPLARSTMLRVDPTLNVAAMDTAVRVLLGIHDFAAFGTTPEGSTVRECVVARCYEQIVDDRRTISVELAASGFLRHMVRTVVGTLLLIGSGRLDASAIATILASRDRTQAGPTAPAHGLYLMSVTYPEQD